MEAILFLQQIPFFSRGAGFVRDASNTDIVTIIITIVSTPVIPPVAAGAVWFSICVSGVNL